MTASSESVAESLGFRPLYRQVKDILVKRIADRVWQTGMLIPSETDLAAELGVSQGTVRKALDAMAADNLLVRRQGRGTFVAEHDDKRMLFQFFKLIPDDGAAIFPESTVLTVQKGFANAAECKAFGLREADEVIRIVRVRSLCDDPSIYETLSLPGKVFAGIERLEQVPNNLYALYDAQYGMKIASAREKLKAVTLGFEPAQALNVVPGTPALQIDRLAIGVNGLPIEWRVSLCLTLELHYLSELK
jgi:GntR family transcriptional regulator